ncbi:HK97 family phage prohead protease [Oryzicola mucosus]|uniref:HK97 family phage prohead protease n=1 Tax=Oryzicola mucosus TaxID=2767425 RepID=A0A8J6PQ38_9HYPH|nr:HK97 family phage prohead protease [Oryzicola mucosus]MBD0416512.1 HK97 family phage prohead protease [Oryzicola mucosus]
MQIETKFSKIEPDAVSEAGEFAGYATRFGIKDDGGDIVMAGAYAKSLGVRMPKMLWSHRGWEPIGIWTKAFEDNIGLRVEGKLALATTKGRETHELMKMGAVNGLSIGYITRKSDIRGNARLLQELDLHEVSVVTFPMQAEATIDAVKGVEDIISGAKSGDFVPLKRAVEGALRDAGFPAWLAKAQAALAPQALSDGSRDASASEIAKLIKDSFKI